MATLAKTKASAIVKNTTKKNAVSKVPSKKRMSKFGRMANCLEGKVKEIGNVWDL